MEVIHPGDCQPGIEFQRQQQLVADGILGRGLMRINQLSGEGIPLLREKTDVLYPQRPKESRARSNA